MEKLKSKIHVILAFFKNTLPLTWKYYGAYFKSVSYDQVMARDCLCLCHALEKGMIYSGPRANWGHEKALRLISIIENMLNDRYPVNAYEIRESMSVLDTYLSVKDEQEVKDIALKFEKLKAHYGFKSETYRIPAGKKVITREELFKADTPIEFLNSRRSVRFFKNEILPESTILEAIQLANTAPTACNRQPCKVYYSCDASMIEAMGKYFKTSYKFETGVPQILIITSKLSLFSSDEYLQPLVNGGIYLETLLLAFHALKIGTCPLEMVSFKKAEKEVRNKLGMGKDEVVVAAVAIGQPMDQNICTSATRRGTDGVAVKC